MDRNIKVLVADYDEDIAASMQSFLNMQADFECCGCAFDGVNALAIIEQMQPDVVILDMVLPIMDGYSVLEEIRAKDSAKQPIIIFTGVDAREVFVCKANDLGADFFIAKPYSMLAVLSRITMLVEDKKDFLLCNSTSRMVSKYIVALGVPTHILAYAYTVRALVILSSQQGPCAIGKKVYTLIANEGGTNVDCIERSVRFGVEEAKRKCTPVFQQLMQFGEIKNFENITTAGFLKLAAEYIKLHDDL